MTRAFSKERRDNGDVNDMVNDMWTQPFQYCFNFIDSLKHLLYMPCPSLHWKDTAIDNVLKKLQRFVCVVAFDNVNDMINHDQQHVIVPQSILGIFFVFLTHFLYVLYPNYHQNDAVMNHVMQELMMMLLAMLLLRCCHFHIRSQKSVYMTTGYKRINIHARLSSSWIYNPYMVFPIWILLPMCESRGNFIFLIKPL